jgi:protein-L-isoaspartate(D-aspartate) O-methyltransferase
MVFKKDPYLLERSKLINYLQEMGIRHPQVLEAMSTVPRHVFVEDKDKDRAYLDEPLLLQEDQTISQPYVVALMTEALLGGKPISSVLEIGTGSGYQTAILAQLADKVYSVERIKRLADGAKAHLQSIGITKVELKHGDGFQGWKEHAPYDGIIVTAAPLKPPPALLEQLADEGRMIIPIGEEDAQHLVLYIRHQDKFETIPLGGVRFVPLLTGVR